MIAVMRWVGIGIIVIIGAVGAWQYMSHEKRVQNEAASVLYESLLSAVRNKDVAEAQHLEGVLIKEHAKSPYATLSALLLASLVPEKTIPYLETALKVAANSSFEHIVRVRLARALADVQKITEALALLNAVNPPESYVRLYEEAKGDIYVQNHQLEKAKLAYALALEATPSGIPLSWLELKQSDLPDNHHVDNSKEHS